ncbi:MAG: WxcM-like domain-containing protein [Bacteroidetes bacterium]|nr:MAG: WxcM-like domain-containing protein [Bacteroidota bacterium]
MAHIIQIKAFSDNRGELRVIEKELPFEVKRVYYIHGKPDVVRGGHRHKHTDQLLICIHGSCIVSSNNGKGTEDFLLDSPSTALYVDRHDWHTMHHFTEGAVLLVLASTPYDINDYIDEAYPEH